VSFNWTGTFRQGQWQVFRSFVLNERRDIERRIRTIEAELDRIGFIQVLYASTTDGETQIVSEERTGIRVALGSSVEKLLQAYVAHGGNPFDISMFLRPDAVVVTGSGDDQAETPQQPHGGVLYQQDDVYATGNQYKGGRPVWTKDIQTRTGGQTTLEDSRTGNLVMQARAWVNQEIRHKRNNIEARIIKLMDLREQLEEELEQLTLVAGGTLGAIPRAEGDQYTSDLSVAKIVSEIDAIFYTTDDDGRANFATSNQESLGYYPQLMDDISPDEDNHAL